MSVRLISLLKAYCVYLLIACSPASAAEFEPCAPAVTQESGFFTEASGIYPCTVKKVGDGIYTAWGWVDEGFKLNPGDRGAEQFAVDCKSFKLMKLTEIDSLSTIAYKMKSGRSDHVYLAEDLQYWIDIDAEHRATVAGKWMTHICANAHFYK